MVTEQEQLETSEHLSASYRIDPNRLVSQGRWLPLLLLHRRCASCWATLIQEPMQGLGIEADEHLKKIASHCSKSPDFIRSEFPVMEAVFRVLLGNSRRPMTLQSIYDALRERWSNPTNPRTPPPDKLYRMLAADTFYGIIEVPQAPQAKGK